ncbi:MAG: hypothetical protein K6T71_03015 [Candidatus Bipolaricaulota bacterium]|nr:hypothetical protein [Candidatus Bipolaricaulota bacterium]
MIIRWSAVVLVLVGLLSGFSSARAQVSSWPIRALWYVSEDPLGYASPAVPTDLKTLKERLCPTHVLLRIHLYQTGRATDDPHIDPRRTQPNSVLTRTITEAQRLGLKVVLLPALFVNDGTWAGVITPANVSRWFTRWREIVRHYAQLAQSLNVDVLLIGTELSSLQRYSTEWERLIREVRGVFSGKISYSANWWYDRAGFQNVLNMTHWALLDYVGITAYFELTNTNTPTGAQLRAAWQGDRHGQNILSDLEALRQRYNKPIVFWELGYQSRDGTNIFPWDYTRRTPPDEQEQADAYRAFFEVFSGRVGFEGYGLFAHQVGLPRDAVGYDLLGKQAESVVSSWHCKT